MVVEEKTQGLLGLCMLPNNVISRLLLKVTSKRGTGQGSLGELRTAARTAWSVGIPFHGVL